jgi:predicted nucleic acid-binding Zn ribbon protein
MRDPDKQSGFIHIGNIIDGVLKQVRSEPGDVLKAVWRLWEETVGGTIAENARPAAIKGNLLIVHVSSSTWMHQLQFLKKDMIAQINAALGKPIIEAINFKIGPLE